MTQMYSFLELYLINYYIGHFNKIYKILKLFFYYIYKPSYRISDYSIFIVRQYIYSYHNKIFEYFL